MGWQECERDYSDQRWASKSWTIESIHLQGKIFQWRLVPYCQHYLRLQLGPGSIASNPTQAEPEFELGIFQFRWGLGLKLQIQFEFLLGWSWVWVWYVLKCNINLGLTWVKLGNWVKFCYDWLKVVFGFVRNLTQIQPSCTTSTINSYIVYFYQSALSYHGLTPRYLISQNCIRVW